jgi:uracil-DNA glycosylase family 4
MPSLFQLHCDRWKRGCGAKECGGSDGLGHGVKVCLARGQIPCDVLFIGEAPGENENAAGFPFVGPAGRLLDRIVERALPPGARAAYGNIVGCLPREEGGGKLREPSAEQVLTCSDRLREFVEVCDPGLVVCVGKTAFTWLDPLHKPTVKLHRVCPVCFRRPLPAGRFSRCPNGHGGDEPVDLPRLRVDHPAFILRANVAQQGLLIQHCIVKIRDAGEEMLQCRSRRDDLPTPPPRNSPAPRPRRGTGGWRPG